MAAPSERNFCISEDEIKRLIPQLLGPDAPKFTNDALLYLSDLTNSKKWMAVMSKLDDEMQDSDGQSVMNVHFRSGLEGEAEPDMKLANNRFYPEIYIYQIILESTCRIVDFAEKSDDIKSIEDFERVVVKHILSGLLVCPDIASILGYNTDILRLLFSSYNGSTNIDYIDYLYNQLGGYNAIPLEKGWDLLEKGFNPNDYDNNGSTADTWWYFGNCIALYFASLSTAEAKKIIDSIPISRINAENVVIEGEIKVLSLVSYYLKALLRDNLPDEYIEKTIASEYIYDFLTNFTKWPLMNILKPAADIIYDNELNFISDLNDKNPYSSVTANVDLSDNRDKMAISVQQCREFYASLNIN